MFCPNCGAAVQGRFCAKCGTAVEARTASAGPAEGATPGSQAYGTGAQPYNAAAGGMSDNVASALCYLLWVITGVLFLALAPYNQNKLIRFHAFQSIFTCAAFFILWIVVGTLPGLLPFILVGMIFRVLQLGGIILWLLLMFKAYNNEKLKLPIIGDLAEKQA